MTRYFLNTRLILWLFLFPCLSLCLFKTGFSENTSSTVTGYWQQVSDVTHTPQSIMYLWTNPQGVVFGKVVTGFRMNGQAPQQTCINCPTPFNNQRILGMTILWGFTQQGPHIWAGGHILDPDRASIYRCTLTLKNHGQQLKVRGYIGIPLLGRTQTWQRLTEAEALTQSQTAFQTILPLNITS